VGCCARGPGRAGGGAHRVGKTLAAFLESLDRLAASRHPRTPPAVPGALRLAAEGARRRRAAQPAGAADRHPAGKCAPRASPNPRSPWASAPVTRRPTSAALHHQAARHPHHDAGVPVPAADVAGPRVAAQHRHGDHRRGARCRGHEARRAPGAVPGAPGPAARAAARRVGLSATVRPVEEVATFLGGARPVEVVRPPPSKTFDLEVVVPVEDMSALASRRAGTPGPRRVQRSAPRSGPTSRSASSTWCWRTAPRSSSRTPAGSPSGCAPGSTRSRTSGRPARRCPRPVRSPPRRSWRSPARRAGPRSPTRCWPGRTTAR
jgi:hypothetical protein